MPDFERLILNRDLKRIVPLLSSKRTDRRLRAVQALGEARAWRAVGELKAMIEDREPIVRTAALDALVTIRRPEALDAVVDALRSPRPEVVEHAWRVLDRAGDEGSAAIVRALPAFRDDRGTLERMLTHLDGRMPGRELIALLDHPDEAVVQRAREKLAARGEEADAALFEAFLSGTERQARAVVELLRPRVGQLVPALVALYPRLGGPARQRMLLYLLSESRAAEIADLLEQELRNPDSRVRTTAMALISRYRERAVSSFKTLLGDPDFPDRARLISYVRQHWRLWGDALVDLLSVGEFDEWRVREFAKMALGGRSSLLPAVVDRFVERGDLCLDDVADLLLFDASATRDNVALLCRDVSRRPPEQAQRLRLLFEAVLERQGPAATELLHGVLACEGCADPRPGMHLLAQRGEPAAPALVDLLRHEPATAEPEALLRSARLRREALEAVVELASVSAPFLVRALRRPDATPEIREALLRCGDRGLPPLVSALESTWREGRDWRTYSDILAAMAGSRTDVLLPLIDHEEEAVRQAAFAALRGRKGEELEEAIVAIVNESIGLRAVAPRILQALDVLEGLRGLRARAAMQRLVTHPDARVRDRALRYVRRMVRFPSGVWQKLDDADLEPSPSDGRGRS